MGDRMYCFDYRQSVDFCAIPTLAISDFRDEVLQACKNGWRVLALFGLPENPDRKAGPDSVKTGLFCVLFNPQDSLLSALRSELVDRYPALTVECPQVHLFEREIFEQWGIVPEGHPWLKPVRVPPDCMSDYPFYKIDGGEVHEVGVGPIHAGVIEPGHFRFQCYGEKVLHLEISLGYQHRGIEEQLKRLKPAFCLPVIECVAGDSTVANATAFCVLAERLTGVDVTEKTWRIRRLGLELERLANHCGDLGAIAGDTGFLPTSSWNGRIRGDFLNLTASICGNRFGRGLVSYAGSRLDLSGNECADIMSRLKNAGRDARGSIDTMLGATSFLDRVCDTGCLNTARARELGVVGMPARACNIAMDARYQSPLSGLSMESCSLRTGKTGDVYARVMVRNAELDDSLVLAQADLEALATMPALSATQTLLPEKLPPLKLAVAQVEGWRGEVCHLAITDQDGAFWVYKLYDPSFHNWSCLALALRDEEISDFPLCNKSFNLSYCGHDL